ICYAPPAMFAKLSYVVAPLMVVATVSIGCSSSSSESGSSGSRLPQRAIAPTIPVSVAHASFGALPDGTPIEIFTLSNLNGVELRAMTYGGIIVSLRTPDRQGKPADIVLGYDNAAAYARNNSPFFGALIGRYGNRIAKGRFTLDGATYTLATNNGPNHLHGGVKGFDKVVWRGELVPNGVAFSYTSADGEEGYPGALSARVTYTLSEQNELTIDYEATTTKLTVVNLTQHTYFNLAGQGSRAVLGHVLTLDASRYPPADATLIPTGEIASVSGTPFDFLQPVEIGKRINDDNEQLKNGLGYDHNFALDGTAGQLRH